MLRPLLAFLFLTLAAFLLAPTVSSVHEKVTELHFDRDTPWQIWKWTDEPLPFLRFPDCGREVRHLSSEITQWPARIKKDEAFTLRGFVASMEDADQGVREIDVDIFLNETKEEPGVFLGRAETTDGGFFTLLASVPFDMKASRYHIVAHAKEERIDCIHYLEHWSDPETDVVSKTSIEWQPVERAVAGRGLVVEGKVLDVVKAPVADATLRVLFPGGPRTVRTNAEGIFQVDLKPVKAGELTLTAEFRGDRYYEASKNATTVDVAVEDLELDATDPITFVRSQPLVVTGHVYVADVARSKELTMVFNGTRVATCVACPAETTLRVPLEEDGAFRVELIVPSSEPGGAGTVTVRGGGLQQVYTSDILVEVPTVLLLDAHGAGIFARTYETNATLVDEAGRPVRAPVAVLSPAGWSSGVTDANGTLLFSGETSCGRHVVQASFNGSSNLRPATAEKGILVCGWLAFIPPWLVATPWWVWPLIAATAFAAWQIALGLRRRYSPILSTGPPLTMAFTKPSDEVVGYAAVGEAIVATAFLEAPLPDGHTLRMGTARATEERPIDGELRAHLAVVPDKVGLVPIRAELVDARGRVVTRRTLELRVVRYAEEIERRYLDLRASSGATESVTPREFEGWLQSRVPAMDADVAKRLVHVFEEADYSPRMAGRTEFGAYLQAEKGIVEVTPDVTRP